MGKKSDIEKKLHKKKIGESMQGAVREATVVQFDDLINYCASLVNTLTGQKIKIFDVKSNILEFEIASPVKSIIRSVKWCTLPNASHKKFQSLVLCCDNGSILLYSLEDNEIIHELTGAHDGPVADFVSQGTLGFSGSFDGKIAKWDIGTGRLLNSWTAHTGSIHKLTLFKDHPFLISGSNSLKVWDSEKNTLIKELPGHINKVNSLVTSSDYNICLSAGHQDRFIGVYKVENSDGQGQMPNTKQSLTIDDEILQIAVSAHSTILCVTEGGKIGLWKNVAKLFKGESNNDSDKIVMGAGHTIHFTTPSKVIVPVLQVACSDDGHFFTLARGDTWNLTFETLLIPKTFEEKETIYEVTDSKALKKDSEASAMASKTPSHITVKSGSSGQGRGATVTLSIGDRLKAFQETLAPSDTLASISKDLLANGSILGAKIKGRGKGVPSMEDSNSRVIQQALRTNDVALLNATLATTPQRSIKPTVATIGDILIPRLFSFFINQIITKKGNTLLFLAWVKEILTQYSSYLVTLPWVSIKLGELIEASSARCNNFTGLAHINTRLEHLEKVIKKNNDGVYEKMKDNQFQAYLENDADIQTDTKKLVVLSAESQGIEKLGQKKQKPNFEPVKRNKKRGTESQKKANGNKPNKKSNTGSNVGQKPKIVKEVTKQSEVNNVEGKNQGASKEVDNMPKPSLKTSKVQINSKKTINGVIKNPSDIKNVIKGANVAKQATKKIKTGQKADKKA